MKEKGFTLVELLAVIVILSILVLVVVLSVNVSINKSRENLSKIQIKNIEDAAEIYYLKEGMDTMEYSLPCVDLSYLLDNGYISASEINNPNSDDKITGSVKILNTNNKYKYEYQNKTCKEYNEV